MATMARSRRQLLVAMARRTVKLSKIPELQVGEKDMRFDIKVAERRVGTLLVSKGGIEWRPYKKQKRHLSWEKFDQIVTITGAIERRSRIQIQCYRLLH